MNHDLRLYTTADAEVRVQSTEITPEELATPEMQEFLNVALPAAMITYDGIGIAAVQVGRTIQAFVVHKEYIPGATEHLVLVNPRIVSSSDRAGVMEEGCLSVPGIFGSVERATKIRVKGLYPDGSPADIKAKGMFARILQHECDHLNATLFIDKLID